MEYPWRVRLLGALLSVAMAADIVSAQQQETRIGEIQRADPNFRDDGSMSPAAAAIERGPSLPNAADTAAKQAATRASEKYEQSAPASTLSDEAASLAAPAGSHSFAGLAGGGAGGATGAIGPFSYIQMINRSARIYNRNTHAVLATASLDQIAGTGGQNDTGFTTFSIDPEIIWDPSTHRFYYVMRSTLGRFEHALAFGFSRTSNPTDF